MTTTAGVNDNGNNMMVSTKQNFAASPASVSSSMAPRPNMKKKISNTKKKKSKSPQHNNNINQLKAAAPRVTTDVENGLEEAEISADERMDYNYTQPPSKTKKIGKKKKKQQKSPSTTKTKDNFVDFKKAVSITEEVDNNYYDQANNVNKDKKKDVVATTTLFGYRFTNRQLRLFFLVATITVLVLLGMIIGLGVHLIKEKNNNNNETNETDDLTLSGSNNSNSSDNEEILPCEEKDLSSSSSSCDDGGIIMVGIGPNIPPPEEEPVYFVPDTCQAKITDWLKATNAELLYTPKRVQQRLALGILYCELDGDLWLNENQLWLTEDSHECSWYNNQ